MADSGAVTAAVAAAVQAIRNGAWDEAHTLVQGFEGEPLADWMHAVLHRIEGDESNARYWYTRAGRPATGHASPDAEIAAIAATLAET